MNSSLIISRSGLYTENKSADQSRSRNFSDVSSLLVSLNNIDILMTELNYNSLCKSAILRSNHVLKNKL